MIIERFESFSKRINEYKYPDEISIISNIKSKFKFAEQKNYKYSVDEGNPNWDIMKSKGYFYSLLRNYRIYFFYNENDEPFLYYADPIDKSKYGFIVDKDNVKYEFKNTHSLLEFIDKYPVFAF